MSRQVKRRYDEMSSCDYYTICVESGDKPKNACRGIIDFKLLGDGKVGDEEELLVPEFPENFKRGHKNYFKVDEPKIKSIDGIEIHGDMMVGKEGWKIDKVMVTNNKTGIETLFPVFTNITGGKTYKFMTDDLSLSHLSSREEERQRELEEMRQLYELTEDRLPGCPPLVKKMPHDEKFSFISGLHLTGKLFVLSKFADAHKTGGFHKLDDIKDVYDECFFPEPSNLNRWKNDVLFGMQRLMGVNAGLIRLCTKIPDKLAVNNQMLKPFLAPSMTLPQAIQKKRIFMIDYEILEGLPTRAGYVIVAPIALFYQRDDSILVPIAIQLQQKPGANNPVFLPSDPENTWILAKMWFNVADSNYHQSIAHLGFTHLKMEGIVVCTHRQIHKNHPVFKILMPHFLYLIAIDDVGIPLLLDEGGYVERLSAIGKEGMTELIKRKNKTWRMDIDGTLPNNLKAQGVDDPALLPHYYYRNDATELYDAIFSYVKNYLDLYYTSDEDVKKDYELQKWRKEIVAPVKDQGLGMLGVFGEKGKFTNKEQVCLTLTSIIFSCSVQHAAVNFRQYEDYGYPPNYPFSLRGSPPRSKDQVEDQELLQSLPDKNTTLDVLVITSVLSMNSNNELGNFEVEYITDEKALRVVEEFRADLARIARGNKQKNNKTRPLEKYWCLNPNRVPNSISS